MNIALPYACIHLLSNYTEALIQFPVSLFFLHVLIYCCHNYCTSTYDVVDIPDAGLLCDLCWSDPGDSVYQGEFGESARGVSYTFGNNAINRFLTNNNLDLICRAHQVVEDGYEFFGNRKLVTVFSAPNYCGEFDNLGGIMTVSAQLVCGFKVIGGAVTKQTENPGVGGNSNSNSSGSGKSVNNRHAA